MQDLWTPDNPIETPRALAIRADGRGSHHCMAWLPQGDVSDQKIAGFIRAQSGQLVECSDDEIRVRIGKKGMLPFLTHKDGRFPVELAIKLDRQITCVKSMTHVMVELRPLVEGVVPEVIRERYGQILRDFRAFFMAQNLERRFSERTQVHFPVEIWPLFGDPKDPAAHEKLSGMVQNISASGLAFVTRNKIGPAEVHLEYRERGSGRIVAAEARIVRVESAEKPEWVYGAKFRQVSRASRSLLSALMDDPPNPCIIPIPDPGKTAPAENTPEAADSAVTELEQASLAG